MSDGALRWLWEVPGRTKLKVLALVVAQALYGASSVVYALLLKMSVDAAAGYDRTGFWRGIILIILLVVLQLVLRAAIRWLTELSKSTLENCFKGRLMYTLLHRDYLRVSAVHSGEWLNRLTNDTVVVANGYVEIVPGLVSMVVKLVFAIALILMLIPGFSLILVPGGALLLLFSWLFRRVLKRLHKSVQEADGHLRVTLQERIGSLLMIRSFAAESQTESEVADKMQAHKDARMRRNRFSNICNIGFGAAMGGMYLLGVGWCGYGILTGTVSFGTLAAVTQLVSQVQAPLANITGYLPRYYAALASAERLMEAECFAIDLEEAKPLNDMVELYEKALMSIGLRDVSFTYYPHSEDTRVLGKDNMPNVLEHVSLDIQKGEYVAFTGQSGCGKSTVLKLLMCVCQPDGGERYYTDFSGQHRELTGSHRRLFSYVPQGNALMTGTIREVVSFSEPESANDEARLLRALRISCAEEFVSELDLGVDTPLGERGAGLSEGQMQRLAIARAVFSNSPILLLDEATSALDSSTEQQLLSNLRSMTDKTAIIVTHRPAALAICDRVLEFSEQGVMCCDA